jgi:hypothetical protein
MNARRLDTTVPAGKSDLLQVFRSDHLTATANRAEFAPPMYMGRSLP